MILFLSLILAIDKVMLNLIFRVRRKRSNLTHFLVLFV